MAMENYHGLATGVASGVALIGGSGNLVIISGATITVKDAGTANISSIFSDEGITALANPFTADSSGRYNFYAADGDYDITVSKTDFTSYTLLDVSFNASNPMTTRGDVIVRDATNTTARLAIGTDKQVLQSDGTDITWESSTASNITNVPAGNIVATDVQTAIDKLDTQITNAGGASFQNLIVIDASTSTVDINADSILLDDGTDVFNARSVNLTATISASGANGLDTGSEASSTMYAVWVIYNGTTVASLLSTSFTAPTMPAGYTFKKLVSFIYNDSGSNFDSIRQVGNKWALTSSNTATPWRYLSAGTSGTAVTLSPNVPSIVSSILVVMRTGTADGDWGISQPATGLNIRLQQQTTSNTTESVEIPLDSNQQHDYIRNGGTGSLTIDLYGATVNI